MDLPGRIRRRRAGGLAVWAATDKDFPPQQIHGMLFAGFVKANIGQQLLVHTTEDYALNSQRHAHCFFSHKRRPIGNNEKPHLCIWCLQVHPIPGRSQVAGTVANVPDISKPILSDHEITLDLLADIGKRNQQIMLFFVDTIGYRMLHHVTSLATSCGWKPAVS